MNLHVMDEPGCSGRGERFPRTQAWCEGAEQRWARPKIHARVSTGGVLHLSSACWLRDRSEGLGAGASRAACTSARGL